MCSYTIMTLKCTAVMGWFSGKYQLMNLLKENTRPQGHHYIFTAQFIWSIVIQASTL